MVIFMVGATVTAGESACVVAVSAAAWSVPSALPLWSSTRILGSNLRDAGRVLVGYGVMP